MLCAVARINQTPRRIWLKLESHNPAGSLKDRTAAYLIDDLETRGLLKSSSIIIESTSGNLGVALAYLAAQRGYRFLAVVDPKVTPENCKRMRMFGAELHLVDEADTAGGYLLSRLKRVEEFCARSSRYVWTNQYANPANPMAHYSSTAPEIYCQMSGKVDAIFIPVSTGGTLAGVAQYFREVSPNTIIVAVDAKGSVIFGGSAESRQLTGIGSSRQSNFINKSLYDSHILVSDQEAFAACWSFVTVGLKVGGSSGATLFACAKYLSEHPDITRAVCVCPDDGQNYASTIFDSAWLAKNGFQSYLRDSIIENVYLVHTEGSS